MVEIMHEIVMIIIVEAMKKQITNIFMTKIQMSIIKIGCPYMYILSRIGPIFQVSSPLKR